MELWATHKEDAHKLDKTPGGGSPLWGEWEREVQFSGYVMWCRLCTISIRHDSDHVFERVWSSPKAFCAKSWSIFGILVNFPNISIKYPYGIWLSHVCMLGAGGPVGAWLTNSLTDWLTHTGRTNIDFYIPLHNRPQRGNYTIMRKG